MKRILCIRPDNMGDILMSTPAIRALKETFRAHITLLTSSAGAAITPFIPEIDATIVFDAPWVQQPSTEVHPLHDVVQLLKLNRYDAAVIFTVYSQNPLPSVMLAYLAGIPVRLAYCRENPYQLLTHWLPDKEPYTLIRHQVQRDLDLVAELGAYTSRQTLSLKSDPQQWPRVKRKLQAAGVDLQQPWLVLHPGVSEVKRQFPLQQWAAATQLLTREMNMQLVLTGNEQDTALAAALQQQCGEGCFNLAGQFSHAAFIALIAQCPLVLSVNTVTAHIAAATGTPVVVLYAQTNPQHTPWKATSAVLYFDVPETLRSRNEVIRFVHEYYPAQPGPDATPGNVLAAVQALYQTRRPFAANNALASSSTIL
ncbi:glycosyltransferase family 9 protein [Chitinophaga sp.]|uniref:glycosyltransferase family 9 protein n=1 Tax=Chitinophaga sp. TaxID=1869181 RepID=UPI0031DDC846